MVYPLLFLVIPFFIIVIFLKEYEEHVRSTTTLPGSSQINTLLYFLRTGLF
jgi:hypothetical protein